MTKRDVEKDIKRAYWVLGLMVASIILFISKLESLGSIGLFIVVFIALPFFKYSAEYYS